MKRLEEQFVEKIDNVIPLGRNVVLEIGCGDGNYTRQLSKYVGYLSAIDPDDKSISRAVAENNLENVVYRTMSATRLDHYSDSAFNVVIFTLSIHHMNEESMHLAIREAVRVVIPSGHIVFLEPNETGSFFEAEKHFDACDGDEDAEKELAFRIIQGSKLLSEVYELTDKTVFSFDSTEDFVESMHPKQNLSEVDDFLKKHNMTLVANRRINIFKPVK